MNNLKKAGESLNFIGNNNFNAKTLFNILNYNGFKELISGVMYIDCPVCQIQIIFWRVVIVS